MKPLWSSSAICPSVCNPSRVWFSLSPSLMTSMSSYLKSLWLISKCMRLRFFISVFRHFQATSLHSNLIFGPFVCSLSALYLASSSSLPGVFFSVSVRLTVIFLNKSEAKLLNETSRTLRMRFSFNYFAISTPPGALMRFQWISRVFRSLLQAIKLTR